MARYRRYILVETDPGPLPLELFMGCLGAYGALAVFWPPLTTIWLGWALLAGVGLGALLHIIEGRVDGHSLAWSLLGLALCGGLVLGLVAAIGWYMHSYVPAHGGLLGTWGQRTPTPVPSPLPTPVPTVNANPYG